MMWYFDICTKVLSIFSQNNDHLRLTLYIFELWNSEWNLSIKIIPYHRIGGPSLEFQRWNISSWLYHTVTGSSTNFLDIRSYGLIIRAPDPRSTSSSSVRWPTMYESTLRDIFIRGLMHENGQKRVRASVFMEKQWYNQVVLSVLERVACYHERAMEFTHARRHNRTMERLTCVGGSVVYRTGIICPPAITRLNYSSWNKSAQTLHCFNRLPIIWRLPMLQTTALPHFRLIGFDP